jgi:hypothetical protein
MALQNAIESISRLATHTFKIEINWTSGINSNSTVFFFIPITNWTPNYLLYNADIKSVVPL